MPPIRAGVERAAGRAAARACPASRPAPRRRRWPPASPAVRVDQRVGHRAQRGVLGRARGRGQPAAATGPGAPLGDAHRYLPSDSGGPTERCDATQVASEQDQVVAVDDLAFVRRAQRRRRVRVERPSSAGQLARVVVDQPAGDQRAVRCRPGRPGRRPRTCPSTAVMPAGSSDLRRPTTAATAPGSRCSRPRGVVAWASQSSRAAGRSPAGWKSVPTSSPASAARGQWRRRSARTGMPAPVAIRAASTLVTMPPVPTPARPAADGRRRRGPSSPRTSAIRVERRAGAGRRS